MVPNYGKSQHENHSHSKTRLPDYHDSTTNLANSAVYSNCVAVSQWRIQTRRLGGAVKLRGAKNVFTCLKTKGCMRQSLCVTQRRLSFVGQKVAIFVGRTMLFFRE